MAVEQPDALQSTSYTNRGDGWVGDEVLAAARCCPNPNPTHDGGRMKCGRKGECGRGLGQRLRMGRRRNQFKQAKWTVGMLVLALSILRFHP